MKNVLIFIGGAAVGVVSAYFFLKKKFEDKTNSDVDAIREMYKKADAAKDKPDISSLTKMLEETDYRRERTQEEPVVEPAPKKRKIVDYTKSKTEEKPEPEEAGVDIEYISREQYEENPDGYVTSNVTLYADGMLRDEDQELVDIPDTIGAKFFNEFARSENHDDVYIANNSAGVLYLLDYSDEVLS